MLCRGDGDAVLRVLEECSSQYEQIPAYTQVFEMFIEKEDPERLQKGERDALPIGLH